MHILTKSLLAASCAALLLSTDVDATGKKDNKRSISDTSLECYFSPVKGKFATPDEEGFIRRWTLLEPINKKDSTNANTGRRSSVFPNTLFTDSYLRDHFNREYFPGQNSVVPKDGERVKVGEQILSWRSYDSNLYNIKLFRFASSADKSPPPAPEPTTITILSLHMRLIILLSIIHLSFKVYIT